MGRVIGFLIALDLLLFALFDLLPDAASVQLGLYGADSSLLTTARERMGLTGPWYWRVFEHWGNVARLDFGRSAAGNYEIAQLLRARLEVSVPLWVGGFSLLILIPIPLSMVYCSRTIGPLRRALLHAAHLANMPQFLAAVILFAIAQALSAGVLPQSSALRWGLAVLSSALLPMGILFTISANSFRSAAQERYCDMYLALGMSWNLIRVILLRNVLLSMRAVAGRLMLGLLLGSVFAEMTFGYTGFGAVFVEALRSGDINVMRAWVLISGAVVLVATAIESGSL
ncbi:MAG: ABC transporter permease subunit [Planctomycetes bacterium]|nr:ABC transporter permease subunit [Planctomycetota bacterium]